MHSIAIFGGTFDPVHNGHIKTSLAIQANFGFDSYYFYLVKAPQSNLRPLPAVNKE